ncbi:MAG TPA: phosphoenolpyruvate--protein phosphotransferase [Candidatus Limnocylindrales bacterium]|jgi:phosphoenolpyruvate-protein phosphotransferase|nr:phosphoenolpyruvate--protein phosphotransferase [Candidatus Limnocylindrales bacterium]
MTLTGRPGSPGIGVGRLLWLTPDPPVAGPSPAGDNGVLQPAVERERLMAALAAAAAELAELGEATASRAGAEVGSIFEAQALFATDPGIVDPALAAIDSGATAAQAIDRVTAEQADKLAGVDDEYFRERAADIRDVGRRVVDRLVGRTRPELHHRDGSPAIVASDDLDPSVVAVIRPELVAGLALAGGAPTGHAAIVARALGIPLVLGLGGELSAALDGADVAVDGTSGRLVVAPDPSEIGGPAELRPIDGAPTAPHRAAAPPVALAANVGSVREAEAAAAAGAEAIGLVRTELLFLGRSTAPGLDEQRSLYRRIAHALPGRPVVFRTLDIGGDKPAPYLPVDAEMNPALGVRGIRLSLSRADLMETQLRALLESNPELPLHVLLPMVATVDEVASARRAIDAAASVSRRAGAAVALDVRLGIMVEIPSTAILADAFAPVVDFFSIGTNDLVQYTLAADRTNAALSELATPLQPAVLRLVRLVTEAAGRHARPVTICGEAAADPLAAALFIGLGVDELSVAPASLERLRASLSRVDPVACREAAERATKAASVSEVRALAERLVAPAEPQAVTAGSPAA